MDGPGGAALDVPVEDSLDDVLAHYGVKGMKWGVRRSEAQLARARAKSPTTPEAAAANALKKKARKSGVGSLTNDELRQLNQRMDLEQKYNTWAKNNPTATQKVQRFVAKQLLDYGMRQLESDKGVQQMKTVFNQAQGKKASSPKAKTKKQTPTPRRDDRVYTVTTLPERR